MPPKKGHASKGGAKKNALTIPEGSEHIVFGDGKKKGKGGANPPNQAAPENAGPPKPTAKQIIGGASWTGKLPVNLLAEHCQKQKWNKPDYSMRQKPGPGADQKLYRSEVTLSRTDPKTRETITLPTFRTPSELLAVSEEPSALEARHFAAAYALFRVSSMKNLSMALPPKYRDLWKGEFQRLKKEDESSGHGWLYDADPFAADQKRKDIHIEMDKRKIAHEKKQAQIAKNPELALQAMPRSQQWEVAPKIEMGAKIRADIESLIRQHAIWNPYDIKPLDQESQTIMTELLSCGFRKAHVLEALEYCSDKQEALEWLLTHVPEDDLPSFALPSNYRAGISLASGDTLLDARVQRLAEAGYPKDLCIQALKATDSDEHDAAFWLQSGLQQTSEGSLNDDIDSNVEWEAELTALEAIYAEKCLTRSMECSIEIETADLAVQARFIIPSKGYPFELPAVLITSKTIPAYIRMSATKQLLQFAETNFKGEPMIFNLCEWLESNLPYIIESPASLTELYVTQPSIVLDTGSQHFSRGNALPSRIKRKHKERMSDTDLLRAWELRQEMEQQRHMNEQRARLPAWRQQKAVLTAILGSQVTVVTGETGSGKSTQVVQFVLDEAIRELKANSINIMCTQPRRVAALSLAERVSNERTTNVGEEVGYTIRGESKTSAATKITFMTTGVLLRRLQTSSSISEALDGISHIFVDEVHERSLDTDFLLALLKDCCKTYKNLKIVLMSATLEKELFVNYFGGPAEVAHVHIEGRTFPVRDHYLEEVLASTSFLPKSDDGQDLSLGKAIQSLGSGINYDLITKLVGHIDQDLGGAPGAILIFLPGTLEIDRTIRAVSALPNVLAYPLHASLLPAEQKRVFPPAPSGKRKVIAATNVAETSITIEDIVAVIDTGKVKETRFDVQNNIVRLEEVWASQAACKQRRGRAGRVREGDCYKLFTHNVASNMAQKTLPEVQRVPLEQLCLSVKATDRERDVAVFLSSLMTPPDDRAVDTALRMLHLMGALEADNLTALGTYLSMIPADLRCAKLLVFGVLFDCIEPCLTIAAVLSNKNPFVSPRERREEADAAKQSFPSQHGDLMLTVSAYDQYVDQSQFSKYKALQGWCGDRFLSHNTLRDITSTRSQLLDSLKDANLIPTKYSPIGAKQKEVSPLLLRALIASALQPQIAEIRFPEKKYMQSLSGAKELDPEAKTIKYYIPPAELQVDTQPTSSNHGTSTETTPRHSRSSTPQPSLKPPSRPGGANTAATLLVEKQHNKDNTTTTTTWSRVFIHPSSPLFHSTPASFTSGTSSANYLSYFSKMATGSPPKTYIHSLTPLNTYTQLLFGSGGISIDASIPGGGLVVGNTFKIRGWARIGVLVSRLRRLLDEELRRAIDQPAEAAAVGFARSEVVRVVKWLVELNGQDR